ncbi:hypothetical protein [Maridesulfovibrio zosterae]|uniref:hypothetical protein n=1 Tax=Maridesulfovibrio zosterae TaxID=82171 RepID=UPI00040F8541|nr:hypothetical protein [Maridesulfovibrio zosterae]
MPYPIQTGVASGFPVTDAGFEMIGMNYALITKSTSSITKIGTWGVTTCATIILYDENTKNTLLGHLQAPSAEDAVETYSAQSTTVYTSASTTSAGMERISRLLSEFEDFTGMNGGYYIYIIPGGDKQFGTNLITFLDAYSPQFVGSLPGNSPIPRFNIPIQINSSSASEVYFDRSNGIIYYVKTSACQKAPLTVKDSPNEKLIRII